MIAEHFKTASEKDTSEIQFNDEGRSCRDVHNFYLTPEEKKESCRG